MQHSFQETKYDLLLLLLPQSTQMEFKQQVTTKHSSGMKVTPKRDKIHFSDLQYIYICIYASHMYVSVNWDITIS